MPPRANPKPDAAQVVDELRVALAARGLGEDDGAPPAPVRERRPPPVSEAPPRDARFVGVLAALAARNSCPACGRALEEVLS